MANETKADLEKKLENTEEEISKIKQEAEKAILKAKEDAKAEVEKLKSENEDLRANQGKYVNPDEIDLNDGELVTLTLDPQFSAKKSLTIVLRKKDQQIINDKTVVTMAPSIKGLPEFFTVRAGQRVKVTKNQFRSLYEQGWIASVADNDAQKELFESIEGTFPDEFRVTGKNVNEGLVSPYTLQAIYNDKLRVVG